MFFGMAEQFRQEQLRVLIAERERIYKTMQASWAAKNGPAQTSLLKQFNEVQKQISELRGVLDGQDFKTLGADVRSKNS